MTTKSIDWFVASCLADKGEAEKPLGSNATKFGVQFGWNKVSWCCEYGWDKYDDAGVVLPIKSASCVVIYDYCVAHGLHYDSTSCVPGDSVIRTWQGLSRNAAGFDAEQTHFQEVLEVKVTAGVKMLGLWGGNQGAGYVGPAIEWVRAGDPTVLGGLAFSRLFTVTQPAVKPTHDKTADSKRMPAAKSHPTALASQSVKDATSLTRRLNARKLPVAADGSRLKLRRARAAITRALTLGRKAKS